MNNTLDEIIFDEPKYHSDRNMWSHLSSNNVEALHRFALKIGLKREWFQDKPGHPHYDIKSERIRSVARLYGAAYVTRRYYAEKIIEWHKSKINTV